MTYRFGPFSLDERSRQVKRGSFIVDLRAKCFDALAFLIRNANATVTKTQMLEALWPDRDIGEASLTQVIYELRKYLGEEAIVTVPSVGYQFTPRVHRSPSTSPFERYVEPADVYELYAKGKFLLEKRGKREFLEALDLFRKVVEKAPDYAPAYVGMAQAWGALGTYIYAEPKTAFPSARAAAQRALELESDLAEAYAVLAEAALFFDRDWDGAARLASTAMGMNASLQQPHHVLAWMLIANGKLHEAAGIVIRTIEVFPTSVNLHATLALIYRYLGDVDRSMALFRGILERDPSYTLARYYLGNSLVLMNPEEAVAELRQVAAIEQTVQVRSSLAYALALAGDRRSAEQLVNELREMQMKGEYVSRYSLAIPQVGLRHFDAAMDELYRAVDERSAWLVFLGVEPRFDAMRQRDDFQALLAHLGLPHAASARPRSA